MDLELANPDVVSNTLDLIAFLFVTPEISNKIRGSIKSWLIVTELFGIVIATLLLIFFLNPLMIKQGFSSSSSICVLIAVYATIMFIFYYFVDRYREAVEALPARIARGLFGVGAGLFLVARVINVAHAIHCSR